MADDILRLLAYELYIPRSVLVDYLKTLMAFHLALYHLKLLQTLPKLVETTFWQRSLCRQGMPDQPGPRQCIERLRLTAWPWSWTWVTSTIRTWPRLAHKSTDRLYRQIPAFVQANFVIKKLDEMAEYLRKTGKLAPGAGCSLLATWYPC